MSGCGFGKVRNMGGPEVIIVDDVETTRRRIPKGGHTAVGVERLANAIGLVRARPMFDPRHIIATVYIPIRTKNPNNGSQGNTRTASIIKAKARKKQREWTARVLLPELRRAAIHWPIFGVMGAIDSMELEVTVTRVAPSDGLDPHDGLGAALKGVIDGAADALGLKSDRDPRVTWKLEQRRGRPKEYAVEITVRPRHAL